MGYVYKNGVLHLSNPLVENAVLNSRYPVLSSWTPSAQNFIFGSSLNSSNSFFGSLDDIKLYNRALSPAEVGAINSGSSHAIGGCDGAITSRFICRHFAYFLQGQCRMECFNRCRFRYCRLQSVQERFPLPHPDTGHCFLAGRRPGLYSELRLQSAGL